MTNISKISCAACLVCLFVFSTIVKAQNAKQDSLQNLLSTLGSDTNRVNTLNALAFELHSSNPRQTIVLSSEAIVLATELEFDYGLAKGNNMKAIGYWYVGEYDSSITFFNNARVLYEKINNKVGLSSVLNNLGNVFRIQGNYPRAIENYQASMKIDEEKGDKEGVAISMINIGLILKNQESHEKSYEYCKGALALFKELDHKFGIGVAYGNIAELDLVTDNYTQSLINYEKAIESLNSIGASCRVIFSELGIADVYYHQERYVEAVPQYKKALKKAVECENPFVRSQCLTGLGTTLTYLNKNEEALEYLLESYNLAKEKNLLNQEGAAAREIYKIYEAKGDEGNALKFFKIYHECTDSLNNEDKVKDIARLEFEYQLEKEKQLALLEQQKQEAEYQVKLRREEFFLEVVIGVAALVLIFAIAIFSLYQKKRRYSSTLEELNVLITNKNQEITASSRELKNVNKKLEDLSKFKEGLTHMIVHDMKNPLNTIIGISQKETDNHKMNLISRSGQLMLNLVMNMLQAQKFEEAGIVLDVKTYTMHDILEETVSQVALFAQMSGVEIEVEHVSSIELEIDKDIMVRVLVNLLTNAIKYSKGIVKVRVSLLEKGSKTAKVEVVDNGAGISPEKLSHVFDKYWHDSKDSAKDASTGLGLAFCKLAIEAHKGKIEVKSSVDLGTNFSIILPNSNPSETKAAKEISINQEASKELIIESESSAIEEYKAKLRGLQVYQISVLKKILGEMDNQDLCSPWKGKLKLAILKGDEEMFKTLID